MTVRGQQRKIRLLFLLFCPICAVLSHSGTSLVVVGFFTVVLVLLHRFGDRIKFPWKMVCTVYGLLAAGVIIMPQNTIVRLIMTKIFHYSADLSGRALLWSGAIEKLKGHALLGYGRSVQDYIPAWGGFFSSHNFWLELLLQGGFVAVILFVVCVCICYQNSGKYLQTKQGKTAAFAFLVMMISAMMESAVHSVYLFGTMTFLYCSKWLVMGDDSNCRQIEEETDRKKKQTETALADLILPVEENTRQVSAKSDFFGPILSVIVPIYNGEHFLQQLISSIILQKMSGLELILVDDGSTDQTLTICREFEKSYEWIKVFHTENMGVSHARNVGLRHAKGKWIHFVDSDDHILPGMYTRFVQMAEHGIENPDVLVCGCIRITANNGEKTSCGPERTGIVTDVNIPKLFDHMSMERRYYLLDYIWNKWYRREVIERYRIRFPENLSLGEDFAFNAKYFQHAEKIVLISECYYQYQIQEDGLVSRFQEEPWKGRKILYREQNELYRKLGLLSENEKWIRQQAGQIAFGDIRMISSPRCSYKWKEKKKFVQKMIKSPQYGLILEYLKAKGETSILFRCYFYLFALRSAEITAGVICFEKKVRDFMRKAFHSIQKGRIGRAKEKS
ncbi:MAG: glycosyltransferase [Fusicatenibacter sp.]|nr:glycosyltransferase [Fusicatenibacter sp.]